MFFRNLQARITGAAELSAQGAQLRTHFSAASAAPEKCCFFLPFSCNKLNQNEDIVRNLGTIGGQTLYEALLYMLQFFQTFP